MIPSNRHRAPHTCYVRWAAIIVACVCAAVIANAQQTSWKEFRSTDGRFAVTMPGEPTVSTGTTTTDLGQLTLFSHVFVADDFYCSVIYYDMPSVPDGLKKTDDALLKNLCDGFVQGAGLREISERRDRTLDGRVARELEAESNDGSYRIIARYVLARPRIYTVVVGVPVDEPANARAIRFLDSFRIVS